MSSKVFVAMSGGVDSSVAVALLKEQGYEVRGVFMKTWSPSGIPCKTRDDRLMAARAAAHLGIPFVVWDFTAEYKRAVVDYMIAAYAAGRTPNPDVMCNKEIKFGLFLKRALEIGADYIATGHYIKLGFSVERIAFSKNETLNPKRYTLYAGRDNNKDQSYFLWTLTQEQLAHCLFPIGDYEKREVRQMARERGLPNWDKKDSQGLCFVGKVDFADFLRAYLPLQEGAVLTATGTKIGSHDGAQFVTVGQRHGLNLGIKNHELGIMGKHETKAHYVVERDMVANTVVVAEEDDPLLYRKKIMVHDVSWISGDLPAGGSQLPLSCFARIRYRQPLQSCLLLSVLPSQDTEYRLKAVFDQPQRAVAPGQSAVFYTEKREMLGGGIIA